MVIFIDTLLGMSKIILSIGLFFVWVVRYENITKEFEGYDYPYWFRDFVGILMLSFSAMIMQNRIDLIILGSLGIIVLMLGALWTHYMVENPLRRTIPAFAVLGLCRFILYFSTRPLTNSSAKSSGLTLAKSPFFAGVKGDLAYPAISAMLMSKRINK